MISLRGHHLKLAKDYLQAENLGYLDIKKNYIINSALIDGNTLEHGMNVIEVLEKLASSDERVTLIDNVDDICKTCNKLNTHDCRSYSSTGNQKITKDESALHIYGLQKRTYTSSDIKLQLMNRKGIERKNIKQ